MEAAKEDGREVWEQQPEETTTEWLLWQAFVGMYPAKKPSIIEAARLSCVNYEYARKISVRWNFPVRFQAYVSHFNAITAATRRQAMLDMNTKHINMATKINEKLEAAIAHITPSALEPKDIVALGKLAAELERKALVDSLAQETIMQDMANGGDNPELKKLQTQASDLPEVLKILMASGALNFGIRQTTEVVVKDDG